MAENPQEVPSEETERITGQSLNERWGVFVAHPLYREDGTWYHALKRFPAALFDREGYIVFNSKDEFLNYPGIDVNYETNQVHVYDGIHSLPEYVRKVDVVENDIDSDEGPDDERPTRYEAGFDEIDIREDNHSVFEWVRKLDRSLIVTDPDFQRNLVWKGNQQSQFIESILLNIPIPPIYVNQALTGEYVLVDGLQRTTTLRGFLKNEFSLNGLRILSDLNGKFFSELDAGRRTKIEDRKLFVFVIKPSAPLSAVYDIFFRINTGGTQLNRQEIRNCLFAGFSTRLTKRLAEKEEFLRAIDKGISPKRMKDREAVLRCIAFTEFDYKDYKGDMDEFLGIVMKEINQQGTDNEYLDRIEHRFSRVMQGTFEIFGRSNFRLTTPWGRGRINIALMEAVYRFFALYSDERDLLGHKEQLVSNYQRLCAHPQLADSIQRSTGSRNRVLTRFGITEEVLGDF